MGENSLCQLHHRLIGRGWVYLTNKRIAFCPTMNLFGFGNVISKGTRVQPEIELDALESIQREGNRFTKRSVLTMHDGTKHKIQFIGFFKEYNDAWIGAICDTVCAGAKAAAEDNGERIEFLCA